MDWSPLDVAHAIEKLIPCSQVCGSFGRSEETNRTIHVKHVDHQFRTKEGWKEERPFVLIALV